ncbi:hypothetical protein Xish_01572 [Xenorhabdus ishibashii]|uniref:EpsG family protein n=1 Tax=Xenorhabdus ishibashii TaxID=1034471 RepID=A0A2D0KG02_9GAMM|nr:hypothetical protein Xish_01572 [Xenorhabdus ishibashii]
MPAQSIFLLFSFFQSIFIFHFLKRIGRMGFTLWIFFLIFFTVSNIYHNQLNGIRQYAALTLLPFLTLLIFEKKYISFLIGCIISMSFHLSAFIFFIFYPLRWFYLYLRRYNFILFLLCIPLYFYLTKLAPNIIDHISPNYSFYLKSKYAEPTELINILTKVYYLPLIFLFFFVYKEKNSNYFDFCIFIFSLTYWSFLMGMNIGLLSRISSYFWFFILFPNYYLIKYYQHRERKIESYCIILYCLIPYLLKVTIFAKNEYIYNSYLFN